MSCIELFTGIIITSITIFYCIETVIVVFGDFKTFTTCIMDNYMIVETTNKFQAYQRVYICFVPTTIKEFQIGYERATMELSENDITTHKQTKIRNKETYHNYDASKHKKNI